MRYGTKERLNSLAEAAVQHLTWLMENSNAHEKIVACTIILNVYRNTREGNND